MASLNTCSFIGNVGKIETKFMQNGDGVTNISLAVNETWKNKDGEKQERCEWVNCTLYRKLSDIASKYVKVGSMIYVEGKLSTRKWQDKDGKDRYTTEIIVSDMQMLSGKSEVAPAQSKPAQPASFDDSEQIPF